MAENKKSIIVYADWIGKFEELNDEEAGRLIKHFFRYVNDLNPIAPDRTTKLMFIDIEASLKRDLIKWEKTLEGRSAAGKASAESRRLAKLNEQNPTKSTNVESVQQNSTNSTDSVNDSVSVNEINTKNAENGFDSFWLRYPKKIAKEKCRIAYNRLSITDKQKISDTLEAFLKYKPFETYTHPNPYTYINQKRWNDEIIGEKHKSVSDVLKTKTNQKGMTADYYDSLEQ